MKNVQQIADENKANPGKKLLVNIQGYLYCLTDIQDTGRADAVVYLTRPVFRGEGPTLPEGHKGAHEDVQAIGAEPPREGEM